jgi:hypothetical protein
MTEVELMLALNSILGYRLCFGVRLGDLGVDRNFQFISGLLAPVSGKLDQYQQQVNFPWNTFRVQIL